MTDWYDVRFDPDIEAAVKADEYHLVEMINAPTLRSLSGSGWAALTANWQACKYLLALGGDEDPVRLR